MNVPLTSFVENPQRLPDANLLGDIYFEANFGLIDIDWETGNVKLQLKNAESESVRQINVELENIN